MSAPVESAGPSVVPPPVTINTTTFTFSRLSYRDSLPLISRMTISPVSRGLNGIVVNCFEGFPSTESATTTVRIIYPGQFGKKLIYGMHSGYLGEEGRVIIYLKQSSNSDCVAIASKPMPIIGMCCIIIWMTYNMLTKQLVCYIRC